MKAYAGIGSRETPPDVLDLMERIARHFGEEDWLLRSGNAEGADKAFGRAARYAEIFLPWRGFGGLVPVGTVYEQPTPEALVLAARYHPAWDRLSSAARKLHARNAHQVLGLNLDDPVDVVICWTPKASGSGGTGQALRIARAYDIAIRDLGDDALRCDVERWLSA